MAKEKNPNPQAETEGAPPPAATPVADPTAGLLEAVRAQGRELQELRQRVERQQGQSSADAIRQLGDGPAHKSEAEIQGFLAGPLRRGVYFCRESMRQTVLLQHGMKRFDNGVQTSATPTVAVHSTTWTGPGSELRDERKKPLVRWGELNLATVPEIAAGLLPLEEACRILEETDDFKQGAIVSFDVGRAIIASIYEGQAAQRRMRESIQAKIDGAPKGAWKAGVLSELPTAVAQ